MPLRPYQRQAVDEIRRAYRRGARAVLFVLPTGGGKTAVAVDIIRRCLAAGGVVLVLVHRAELIRQMHQRLTRCGVEAIRVIAAGAETGDPEARVVLASIQTLTRRGIEGLGATLIVFDETHHVVAPSWRRLATGAGDARILGITATPQRGDGQPLGDVYDSLVEGESVRGLTDMGVLVPARVYRPASRRKSLARDPVDAYLEFCDGRRTLVFCPTLVHARRVTEDFLGRGIPAACVEGGVDREQVLADFRAGLYRVIVNCHVLTEGFDDPGVSGLILARACSHVGTWLQIVGRVLRAHPGKTDAVVVDLRGSVLDHGLPDEDRTYSLTGDPIRIADRLGSLRQCDSCGAVFRPQPACPLCGVVAPVPELPAVRRARMQEAAARDSDQARGAFLARMQGIARQRGYRSGWAAVQYKNRYGRWPSTQGAA